VVFVLTHRVANERAMQAIRFDLLSEYWTSISYCDAHRDNTSREQRQDRRVVWGCSLDLKANPSAILNLVQPLAAEVSNADPRIC
jgi:hypothetical protein